MNHAVMDKIEEIFGHPERFTPENMESLVHETLKFFSDLRLKLESKDEKEREEGIAIASALKTKLEEQAANLCQSVGMDPHALEAYINDPSNFTEQQVQAMNKAKADLEDYKKEIAKDSGSTVKAPKKKKIVHERFMG
jgi:hypothetical protein